MGMHISERMVKDTRVVVLYGEFDNSARREFQTVIDREKEAQSLHIILDLTHVPAVDRFGLGMIFLVAHHLRRKGGRTSIVNPQPQVRVELERADFPSLVQICQTEDEAQAAA